MQAALMAEVSPSVRNLASAMTPRRPVIPLLTIALKSNHSLHLPEDLCGAWELITYHGTTITKPPKKDKTSVLYQKNLF